MFRPVFEVLEKREVFAAGPLAEIPMVITGAGPGAGPHIHEVRSAVVTPVTRSVAASPAGAYTYIVGPNVTDVVYVGGSDRVLTAGTMGRGLADFNNDGRVDGSDFVARRDWTGTGSLGGIHGDLNGIVVDDVFYFLLPYIEQDNLYKFAGNRATGGVAELAASDVYFSRLGSDENRPVAAASAIQLDFDDSGNVVGLMPTPSFSTIRFH